MWDRAGADGARGAGLAAAVGHAAQAGELLFAHVRLLPALDAAEKRIPCFTSIDTMRAAVQALATNSDYEIATLREYVE